MKKGAIMVSIVVVTYNHEKYIEQCIKGFLMQKTTFPIEIIIGDDLSSDNNREKITKAVAQNEDALKTIHLLFHDKNLGPTHIPGKMNLMEGLNKAQGQYIALCEGDDYWTDPLKLQKQVDFLEANPKFSACFHPVKVWVEDEAKLIEDNITRVVPKCTSTEDLIEGNYIHTPSILYRNRSYPDWFVNVPIGDYALHLMNSIDGDIYRFDEVMAVYRVHSRGMMQQYRKAQEDTYGERAVLFVLGMQELYEFVFEHTKSKRIASKLYSQMVFLKEASLQQGKFAQAQTYAQEILEKHTHRLSFKSKLSLYATAWFPRLVSLFKMQYRT